MNNIFDYATKELSQDAMLSWCINWINYPDDCRFRLGNAMMDMFLGNSKSREYFNVKVIRQYKKIDVLVFFNDDSALIIEDKTDTSEHDDQINRYQEILANDYPNKKIFVSYIKTGIIYDADARTGKKCSTVVDLNVLYKTLKPYADTCELLTWFCESLKVKIDTRADIDALIDACNFANAFGSAYGQFSFLDRVFSDRSKGVVIGLEYLDEYKKKNNSPVYVDEVYTGSNNGGSPWTQYCIWGKEYSGEKLSDTQTHEYNYLFWRIDTFVNRATKQNEFYISLRHYDPYAKKNADTSKRKKITYRKLFDECVRISEKHSDIFRSINGKEKMIESDLLFIPVSNLASFKSFTEIKLLLNYITDETKKFADTL